MILLQKHDTNMGVLKYFEESGHVKTRWARATATGEGRTELEKEEQLEVEGLGAVASGIVFKRKGS